MKKSQTRFCLLYTLNALIIWILLPYFHINLSPEILSGLLRTILNALIAIIALIFAIQIPRLDKFKKDLETQTEIKQDWQRFLERFITFIIFILVSVLLLESISYPRFSDFILALTMPGMYYIFKSTFSYVRNI